MFHILFFKYKNIYMNFDYGSVENSSTLDNFNLVHIYCNNIMQKHLKSHL